MWKNYSAECLWPNSRRKRRRKKIVHTRESEVASVQRKKRVIRVAGRVGEILQSEVDDAKIIPKEIEDNRERQHDQIKRQHSTITWIRIECNRSDAVAKWRQEQQWQEMDEQNNGKKRATIQREKESVVRTTAETW